MPSDKPLALTWFSCQQYDRSSGYRSSQVNDDYQYRDTHAPRPPGYSPEGGPEYVAVPHARQDWGNGNNSEAEGFHRTHPSVGASFPPSGLDSFHRDASFLPPHHGLGVAQSSSRSGPPSGHSYSSSPEDRPVSLNPGLLDHPYPDAGDYLRNQIKIPRNRPLTLHSLPDPPPGEKPGPLHVLVKLAIYGSPRQKLTLREIFTALEDRFEVLKGDDQAWKVCHVLLQRVSKSRLADLCIGLHSPPPLVQKTLSKTPATYNRARQRKLLGTGYL